MHANRPTLVESLLRPESLGGSLGVYVPAVGLQRVLNLARTLLFVWLLAPAQLGLWGLGVMVFSLGSTVVGLGGVHGIARYVSQSQARGQLRTFYETSMGRLTLLAAALTGLGLALGPWLAELALGTRADAGAVSAADRQAVFDAALLNGLLIAVYLNLTGWLRGLRVYRLLALTDVLYGGLSLGLGLAVLLWQPTALAALGAHAGAIVVALGVGLLGLRAAVDRLAGAPEPLAEPPAVPLGRLLRFSVLAMLAALLWQAQGYVSLWFVQRFHDAAAAGLYHAWVVLGQMVTIVAATVWAVVYSHVSVRWEAGEQAQAKAHLAVTYKAVTLGLTALVAGLVLTAQWWSAVLPESYRDALAVVPWLLMHFLAVANAGYAQVASNLRERPAVSVAMALAAGLANGALAAWLVPGDGPLAGAVGAAQSAGLGSLACLAVGGLYVARSGLGARGVVALSFSPLLLLLPPLGLAGAVLVLLALSLWAPWPISPAERTQFRALAGRAWQRLRAAGRP